MPSLNQSPEAVGVAVSVAALVVELGNLCDVVFVPAPLATALYSARSVCQRAVDEPTMQRDLGIRTDVDVTVFAERVRAVERQLSVLVDLAGDVVVQMPNNELCEKVNDGF